MKAQDLQLLLDNGNVLTPEHIVYEANDDAMLFYFSVEKAGKPYHSKATIDWSGLNWIISKCTQMGVEVYDQISSQLFDSFEKIREYQFDNVAFVEVFDQEQLAA
jgi:hypothetical protein